MAFKWPTEEEPVAVRKLWHKHGGDQHGPRVETMTIPEVNFNAFITEVIANHTKLKLTN